MEQLFTNLSHAVEGSAAIALGASFVWGILSIILSPCHLASIPLIVGFISGQGRVSTARASGIATLFRRRDSDHHCRNRCRDRSGGTNDGRYWPVG